MTLCLGELPKHEALCFGSDGMSGKQAHAVLPQAELRLASVLHQEERF